MRLRRGRGRTEIENMVELPGGTVTFLLTDVEGSTALWEEAPEAMRAALARHDALFEEAVAEHGGVHIRPRGEGDSRFAAFASAPGAVAASITIQRAFADEPWLTPRPIRVRIGVHTGEAELRDGDYYGSAVNRCARLRGIGHGGQVLLSGTTTGLVRDSLPEDATLVDLGEHRLRDLRRTERVHQLLAAGLSTDFPPLVSLDARPNNLPIQPTQLVGRDWEVQAVRRLILRDDVRLVTLTGPGGTGKTRLGLEVAANLLNHFPDGVFFADLAPISDPDFVIWGLVTSYLNARRLLLLLDNFEQILAAAPVVSMLLATCPSLTALVTSRATLHIRGEHEFTVPPLELPTPERQVRPDQLMAYPAIALFARRATDAQPAFALTTKNAATVVEICRRVDGLPLAIELAAARVKLLPPQALLERLGERLKLLTGGARDVPARQRTLRDAIAWSHDLLSPQEQTLFRRLAVFAGGCTLEAVEAVGNADGELDTLEGMASLIDESLLRQIDGPGDEPRFAMLETIREYGLERLEVSRESGTVQERHATYFASLAEALRPHLYGPDQVRIIGQLETEQDNF